MTKRLMSIFQTCIKIDYYLKFFRIAKTIILKKNRKKQSYFIQNLQITNIVKYNE